ncbi:hypothetical protein A2p35 [Lactobacillus phage A2]|uniref:Uncharacterized protein n=1 Tax=Lactobacillus phage A2 TaxID=51369 RepID=Q9T0Y4_9CAUD|nr:hypothetical protein A2p35 [Lactobacillus phage A2]CAB63669.1 hypothetical protein [Lactobacillus phage A2]
MAHAVRSSKRFLAKIASEPARITPRWLVFVLMTTRPTTSVRPNNPSRTLSRIAGAYWLNDCPVSLVTSRVFSQAVTSTFTGASMKIMVMIREK